MVNGTVEAMGVEAMGVEAMGVEEDFYLMVAFAQYVWAY